MGHSCAVVHDVCFSLGGFGREVPSGMELDMVDLEGLGVAAEGVWNLILEYFVGLLWVHSACVSDISRTNSRSQSPRRQAGCTRTDGGHVKMRDKKRRHVKERGRVNQRRTRSPRRTSRS